MEEYKVKIEDNEELKYCKWYEKGKWMNKKELMLRKMTKETQKKILKKENREKLPILIIIDGVDAVGKTTVVENTMKQLNKEGKCIFNRHKRRREDKELFKDTKIKTEYIFRKEVVEQINKRMIDYKDGTEYIILDKSPYSEYYYQKTSCFDRNIITPYGNHKIEEEIFRYKEIMDNAIVIFLENDECWKNYEKREYSKKDQGHRTSYPILTEDQYMEMVTAFKNNYKKMYKKVEEVKIYNDTESWKRVYKIIEKQIREKQQNK